MFPKGVREPRHIGKRQQRAENIQDSLKLVKPLFYSYLGFGLKAARLATLGALETKGLSEYQFVAGDSGSDANCSSPLPFLGIHSVEQRVVLHNRHRNG